jgi:hypothetical protein
MTVSKNGTTAAGSSRKKTTATGEKTTAQKAKEAGLAVPADSAAKTIDYNKHPEKLEFWEGTKAFDDVSRVGQALVELKLRKFSKFLKVDEATGVQSLNVDENDEDEATEVYMAIAELIDAAGDNIVNDRAEFMRWVRNNEDGDFGAINLISVYVSKLGE